jgi:hypothetical protein
VNQLLLAAPRGDALLACNWCPPNESRRFHLNDIPLNVIMNEPISTVMPASKTKNFSSEFRLSPVSPALVKQSARVRYGSWSCENSSAVRGRRSISEKLRDELAELSGSPSLLPYIVRAPFWLRWVSVESPKQSREIIQIGKRPVIPKILCRMAQRQFEIFACRFSNLFMPFDADAVTARGWHRTGIFE